MKQNSTVDTWHDPSPLKSKTQERILKVVLFRHVVADMALGIAVYHAGDAYFFNGKEEGGRMYVCTLYLPLRVLFLPTAGIGNAYCTIDRNIAALTGNTSCSAYIRPLRLCCR